MLRKIGVALGRWCDRELEGINLQRSDLRLRFRFRGRRYYIETFNPLWWICVTLSLAGAVVGLWAFMVLCILAGPAC